MPDSTTNEQQADPSTLKLIEGVLDFIRGNLSNIRNTWGMSSPQYKAASEMMQKYLDENMKRLRLDPTEVNLEDLLSNLSLEDKQEAS